MSSYPSPLPSLLQLAVTTRRDQNTTREKKPRPLTGAVGDLNEIRACSSIPPKRDVWVVGNTWTDDVLTVRRDAETVSIGVKVTMLAMAAVVLTIEVEMTTTVS